MPQMPISAATILKTQPNLQHCQQLTSQLYSTLRPPLATKTKHIKPKKPPQPKTPIQHCNIPQVQGTARNEKRQRSPGRVVTRVNPPVSIQKRNNRGSYRVHVHFAEDNVAKTHKTTADDHATEQ